MEAFGINETIAGIEAHGLSHMVPTWLIELGRSGSSLYDATTATSYSVKSSGRQRLPMVPGGIYPDELVRERPVVYSSQDITSLHVNAVVVLAMIATKGNAIGMGVLDGLNRALDYCEQHGCGLVIAGRGKMFGAGANLAFFLQCIEAGNTAAILRLLKYGQETFNRLCFSTVPTVAAPHGITFGGSSELCLACDRIVADADLRMGQTELQVGVTPGWGGLMRPLKQVLQGLNPHFLWGEAYQLDPALAVKLIDVVYGNYAWIKTSRDAYHARDMGFLGPEDVIVPAQGLGQPWVLGQAAKVAESMLIADYKPPAPFVFNLPGKAGFAKLQLAARQGLLMDSYPVLDPEHNTICAERAAWVLCGGDNVSLGDEVSENHLLELEGEAFMDVVARPGAAAYIRKLLKK